MSEIKALDKLRNSSHLDDGKWTLETGDIVTVFGSRPNDPNAVNWGEQWRKIADDIEAEIADRFHLLPEGWTAEQAEEVLGYWPKWDDGTPCMFGDEFACFPKYDHEQEYEVLDRLVIYGQNHVWNRGRDDENPHYGGYYEWNYMRPVGYDCESYRPTKRKPRTLEDVLEEYAHEYYKLVRDGLGSIAKLKMRKAADEIRELLLGGDA